MEECEISLNGAYELVYFQSSHSHLSESLLHSAASLSQHSGSSLLDHLRPVDPFQALLQIEGITLTQPGG